MQLIDSILDGLRNTSAPEAVAVVLGLAYSLLAVRRVRWCWVAGGISSAIFMVLAWRAKLPMQSVLQAYYVGMAVYGFWHWSTEDGDAKAVSTWPVRAHFIAAIGIVAAAVAIMQVSALLARYLGTEPPSAWPFLDSLTTAGSLFATWLTAQVKLENWLYWIVFDAMTVFLFAAQGLMFGALLMLIYLVVAAVGFVSWSKSRRAPAPGEAA